MSGADDLVIEERDGFWHLTGVLNENADLSAMLGAEAPLRINLGKVTRFNSIGIRNTLKFLQGWGNRTFEYYECPVEFINQINMIPSLLGTPKRSGSVVSLYVPLECDNCEHEADVLMSGKDLAPYATGQAELEQNCPKCTGGKMSVPVDTFFLFLAY